MLGHRYKSIKGNITQKEKIPENDRKNGLTASAVFEAGVRLTPPNQPRANTIKPLLPDFGGNERQDANENKTTEFFS